MSLLLRQTLLLGEGELLTLAGDSDIPKMLYCLGTVDAGLCWYMGRYLASMTGELAKVGH